MNEMYINWMDRYIIVINTHCRIHGVRDVWVLGGQCVVNRGENKREEERIGGNIE